MLVELVKNDFESLETNKHEDSGCDGEHIHAATTGQSDGCRHPKTCCRRQTAHHILTFVEDNGTRTDETDTRHYLSRYTGDIPTVFWSR